MATTLSFIEYNGAAQGSPVVGSVSTTQTSGFTCNWKSVDTAATSPTVAPISVNANSYEKFLYGQFNGSFNKIQNGFFAHTLTNFGTGVTLFGQVTNTYTTPSASAGGLSGLTTTAMTTPIAATSGIGVNFSASATPAAASAASVVSGSLASTQWLVTQLRTTTGATAGSISPVTLTLQYDEN